MKFVTIATTLYLTSLYKIVGANEGNEPERIIVGPDYTTDLAWFNCSDCEKGTRFDLFMPIADTTFNCEPDDFRELNLKCTPNCGQIYGTPGTRNITVYIPAAFDDSDEAAVHIDIEGTDYFHNYDAYKSLGVDLTTWDGREFPLTTAYPNLMDNLIGAEDENDEGRSLPTFVYVAVGLAGPGSIQADEGGAANCGDGPGTPRAIELGTVSDAYAEFIALEVLPYVANHADIKAKYPNFHFTEDPLGRVIQGESNGGAAAFKAVFLRPDLFGTAIGISPALAQQAYFLSSDDKYPLNNAEFFVPPPEGQGLIAAEPLQNGRFYLNANENDVGTENGCRMGGPTPAAPTTYNNFLTGSNETANALAKKGYEVRFAYGVNACHTDLKIVANEVPKALLWAWSAWKDKVESSSDEDDVDVGLLVDDSGSVVTATTTTILATITISATTLFVALL